MPLDNPQQRSGATRIGIPIAVVFFLCGTLLWWPFGLIGIVALVMLGRWLPACILGVSLDLAYHAPTVSLGNFFGFPFLGAALILCIAMYVSQRAIRQTSYILPGIR